jgi:hypothetical protein
MFGARAGWLGAFCAAVSPFQVQYSQEVRMYILVALLGLIAVYALTRWLEQGQTRWSALYVVATAAGFWTHYSFPIVTAALNVAWLVWWIRLTPLVPVPVSTRASVALTAKGRRKENGWDKRLLWWVVMHLVVLALYLPWLSTAWSRIAGYGPISERHSVSFIVGQALKLLSVGETVPDDDLARWMTLGMVSLAVLGAWGAFSSAGSAPARRRLSRIYALTLVLLVLAPIAMMVGLALGGRPAFRPKFFLVASPPFCLLVGAGISWLERSSSGRTMASRLWLLAGLAVVGVGAARSLRNYYLDPAYARSDYRAIAAYVESIEREGDAILLNAPNQWEVFTYYHHQHVPVYPLNRTRPPVEAEVVVELEEIAARHDRLFALYWAVDESDPNRIVERWLETHTFKAADTWYGEVRLVTYAVPDALETVEMEQSLADVRFGEAIALRGYTLAPGAVRKGDILQVTLFWEALSVPADRYKVFVHLVDAGGEIVAQYDGEPGHGMALTTGWSPDRGRFPDRYGVLVPVTLPDGAYQLLVGMYHVTGVPRLSVAVDGQPSGDSFHLATIHIE